ncbi:hypothetical protein BJF89_17760 [Corynebacterium sp. CNJ-954]|nr:hypothetical protein BJF89_17760 [Corynebacterium sp. CNJ-954]
MAYLDSSPLIRYPVIELRIDEQKINSMISRNAGYLRATRSDIQKEGCEPDIPLRCQRNNETAAITGHNPDSTISVNSVSDKRLSSQDCLFTQLGERELTLIINQCNPIRETVSSNL